MLADPPVQVNIFAGNERMNQFKSYNNEEIFPLPEQNIQSLQHKINNKKVNNPLNVCKIDKLDMTKYDNYYELTDMIRLKSMKYFKTKEFELRLAKNPDAFIFKIAFTNISYHFSKDKKISVTFSNSIKNIITVTYLDINSSYSFITTKIYYNNILYSSYAYDEMEYCERFYTTKNDILRKYRMDCIHIGYENNKSIYALSALAIYKACPSLFYKYRLKCPIGYVFHVGVCDLTCLDKYDLRIHNPQKYIGRLYTLKPSKICPFNNEPYNSKKFNAYADIDEYKSYINICGSNKINFITTYGNSWSNSKKERADKSTNTSKLPTVTRSTNTDLDGTVNLDCILSSDNNLVSLEVAGKRIKLDDMVGYKIVNVNYQGKDHMAVLELKIPKEAKIATNDTHKFRCDRCIPAKVYIMMDNELKEIDVESCRSYVHTKDFIYYIGKECYPDSFNGDLKTVCTNGIHYYNTMKDAINEYGSQEMKTTLLRA